MPRRGYAAKGLALQRYRPGVSMRRLLAAEDGTPCDESARRCRAQRRLLEFDWFGVREILAQHFWVPNAFSIPETTQKTSDTRSKGIESHLKTCKNAPPAVLPCSPSADTSGQSATPTWNSSRSSSTSSRRRGSSRSATGAASSSKSTANLQKGQRSDIREEATTFWYI